MTKAELVAEVSAKTGIEKIIVQQTVESMMKVIKNSLAQNRNVYLRGFGSFIVKKRAQKTGRIITKNTTIIIPEHYIPAFKPAKVFIDKIKNATSKPISSTPPPNNPFSS
ncbi:MAG TPA: HU family DNA-binding protein [Bacteroidia bacterium]|nr:HU family DNA-binding protein [Bacteroidia bacterium]HNT79060.1 HU family DNA-binding protein [Bacteroidia bacterium]